ncbi:hypothetical protein E6W39_06680 [Kitasatospora acidiphila]|uniref:Uncharacterized protein n=1 Tax=Kitasatospora acidiphila TaxID=2567942 RepID=A0A540VZ21_9ACTN|nr:hypothetical protein [Kitasatospora acidiphila]TQF02019.1 hypothetical protein E6W39_06680 [Kitasatospora acidiphila]
MSRAKFAFAAHPDAIADLRQLPEPIRDQALLHLQDLVHGERVASRLDGRLEGFHKIVLGAGTDLASHRLVVQFRDAPPTSTHPREVYLVAAGPRLDYAVYRSAQNRLGRTGLTLTDDMDPEQEARIRATQEARVRAARARSASYPQNRSPAGTTYTTTSPGFALTTARKAR